MLSDHKSDLLLATVAEFMDSFLIIGYDDDGEVNCFSHSDNPMKQHALRQLLSDTINTECVDMLLPATNHGERF